MEMIHASAYFNMPYSVHTADSAYIVAGRCIVVAAIATSNGHHRWSCHHHHRHHRRRRLMLHIFPYLQWKQIRNNTNIGNAVAWTKYGKKNTKRRKTNIQAFYEIGKKNRKRIKTANKQTNDTNVKCARNFRMETDEKEIIVVCLLLRARSCTHTIVWAYRVPMFSLSLSHSLHIELRNCRVNRMKQNLRIWIRREVNWLYTE